MNRRCIALALSLLCGCAESLPPQGQTTPATTPTKGPGTAKTPAKATTVQAHVALFGANRKIRPTVVVQDKHKISLFAARNEFEPFQIALRSSEKIADVDVKLLQPFSTGSASIAAKHVTFYQQGLYYIRTASNKEGGAGLWPDPLIPGVDTYVGEKRNGLPFTVAAEATRAIWADIFVPPGTPPGKYTAVVAVTAGAQRLATLNVTLEVGKFTLPSTASLKSAFDMDYAQPCKAHTGTDTCDKSWNEQAAYALRERYVRSGLEHRFTIFNLAFQPPFASHAGFNRHMQPLIDGTSRSRLKGARVTAVKLDGDQKLDQWIRYAKKHKFFDRLLFYPADEPSNDKAEWGRFRKGATALHKIDARARVLLTAPIQEAKREGVANLVDVFVPVINHLEDRPESGDYAGPQHKRYAAWQAKGKRRELWAYQSCMSHGCGKCGEPSLDVSDQGWPSRVIDAGAVQTRAFPWLAYRFGVSGELYFEVAEQLTTAWRANGQCKFSGSGDGTLFYPGAPSRIGGKTHIPIESVRIKLIREGMEDYEYLVLAAKRDPKRAKAIAKQLFPHAYSAAQPGTALQAARRALFDLIQR